MRLKRSSKKVFLSEADSFQIPPYVNTRISHNSLLPSSRWPYRRHRVHPHRQDHPRLRPWVASSWAGEGEAVLMPDPPCSAPSRRAPSCARPTRWTRVARRSPAKCAAPMQEVEVEAEQGPSEPSTTTSAPATTTTAAAATALAMEPPNWEACSKASPKCRS